MTQLSALHGPSTPAVLSTLAFGFAPRAFARRNAAKYGNVYRVKSMHGSIVFTKDPEHLKRIFSADSDTFASFSETVLDDIFGQRSVLITSGPTHKRQRKLLTPPLTGAKLRAFGATMSALADARLAPIRAGETLRVHDLTTEFTLDVIVRVVFGADTPQEEAELRELLRELVQDMPPLAVFLPWLRTPMFPPWGRYLRAQKRFRAWLERTLAARRARPRESDDVLTLLLGARYDDGTTMGDEEIHDQLVTLLLAGHETTAIALASAVHRILHNPRVLTKLREELETRGTSVDEVVRLPYLGAVLDETLRIDPIVTDVARVPKAPFALDDGLVVGPKEILIAFIEAVHLDPTIYPEPEAFKPERFLERKFAPHEFLPFGGGVRRCLGAAFSDYESKIFLAAFVRALDVALVHKDPDARVRRNVTMGPKRGVPVRVVRVRPR